MILIVGATGSLGSAVTHMLLAQGKPVRILARPQSNYKPLQSAGAEVVLGDLKDPASLDAACRGVDTVITTANSAQRGGEDNVENVDLKGNRDLIDAARRARVKQFIFVSVLGASPESPVPFLAAKGQTDKYLIDSGLPYTILSPDSFLEFWVADFVGRPALAGAPVTLVGEGKRVHSMISARDVAQFIVAAIGNPQALNRLIPLGGPQAISYHDVIAAYEHELGRPISVQFVPPGSSIPGMPDAVSGLASMLDMYDSPVKMDETARIFNVRMTSLQEFVHSTIQPR
ncbi:MAG TPA: SDR family oxidoreductase [Anaerolineales bacterium]